MTNSFSQLLQLPVNEPVQTFTLLGKRVIWHIICNIDNVNIDNIDMLLTMTNMFVSVLLVKQINVMADY